MKVKIEMVKNMDASSQFAKEVKDITKDLIETCSKNGVIELTYIHDYFKIHIEQFITVQAPPLDIENIGRPINIK